MPIGGLTAGWSRGVSAPRSGQGGSGKMEKASIHPNLLVPMVAVQPSRSGARRDWRHWLALGVCFGLGHGIAERLIRAQGDSGGSAGYQRFGVQSFPGESLESLRRRHGGAPGDLLVDFESLEQDKRNQKDQAEAEKQRSELEDRQRADERQAQQDAERARLDALDGVSPSTPAGGDNKPLESLPQPAPPQLEVPAPSTGSSPEPAAGATLKLPALPEAPPAPSPETRP